MNSSKNKNEQIIKKVLSLMDKGHDMAFCLKKYPGYSSQIKEHFDFLDNFENLKGIRPDFSRKQELFSRILKENQASDVIAENNEMKNAAKEKTKVLSGKELVLPEKIRKNYLKPVLAFCLSFVFVLFAFTGTVFASEKTLPGEILYPVKITAEKMQALLYPKAQKGRLYYDFLNKRISEADRLIENEINPDDENFIFILAQIEEQYNNCKRYGYFMENNDSDILEQMRQIRRHGMKYQNGADNTSDSQETKEYSSGNETGTMDSTGNCMDGYDNLGNDRNQNKETNKKGTGNNGKK